MRGLMLKLPLMEKVQNVFFEFLSVKIMYFKLEKVQILGILGEIKETHMVGGFFPCFF
jgi:hypothetical protein